MVGKNFCVSDGSNEAGFSVLHQEWNATGRWRHYRQAARDRFEYREWSVVDYRRVQEDVRALVPPRHSIIGRLAAELNSRKFEGTNLSFEVSTQRAFSN